MRAKVIAVVNDKGGVGKSLLSTNLAYILAKKAKTLLLDFDVQANTSVFYREDFANLIGAEEVFTKDPTLRYSQAMVGPDPVENLFISTANRRLGENAALAANTFPLRDYLLRNALRTSDDDFEYVVIDCPPSPINLQKDNAIACANEVVIPLVPDISAFQGVVSVVNRISLMNNENPTVRLIINAYQRSHKSINRRMEEWIEELRVGLDRMLASNRHGNPLKIIFDVDDIKIPRTASATESHSLYYPLDIADKGSLANLMLHKLADRLREGRA